MSNEEENSNTDDNRSDKVIMEHLQEEEKPKAIKAAEELQKEERESEQLNVDPEQVLEEEGSLRNRRKKFISIVLLISLSFFVRSARTMSHSKEHVKLKKKVFIVPLKKNEFSYPKNILFYKKLRIF